MTKKVVDDSDEDVETDNEENVSPFDASDDEAITRTQRSKTFQMMITRS